MASTALDVPKHSFVPDANGFEKGSTVLVLGNADAGRLGAGFAFWAALLFGAGYFIGTRRIKMTLKGKR